MLKLGCKCNGFQSHSFSLLYGLLPRFLLFFYSTSTSPSSSYSRKITISFSNYLVNSLGFSKQPSLSTSNKLIQYRPGRPLLKVSTSTFPTRADSVISFLKQLGFNQPHINKVVFFDPRILLANIETTLKPRFQILQELGFSSSDLVQIASRNPGLLFRNLKPAILALRAVLGNNNDENVARVLKKSNWVSLLALEKNLIDNVALLENYYGIPSEKIQRHFVHDPSILLPRTDLFRNTLIRVEQKWGVSRESGMFMYAIRVLGSCSEETLESKFQIFRSFGWTESHMIALIRHFPSCLTGSAANIRKKLDFLMNQLGLEPAYVASRPALITYSLEKRLVPRHCVLQVLKENGLLRTDYPLYNVACLSEVKFSEKFVQAYKDTLPDIVNVYDSRKGSSRFLPKQGREKSQSQT